MLDNHEIKSLCEGGVQSSPHLRAIARVTGVDPEGEEIDVQPISSTLTAVLGRDLVPRLLRSLSGDHDASVALDSYVGGLTPSTRQTFASTHVTPFITSPTSALDLANAKKSQWLEMALPLCDHHMLTKPPLDVGESPTSSTPRLIASLIGDTEWKAVLSTLQRWSVVAVPDVDAVPSKASKRFTNLGWPFFVSTRSPLNDIAHVMSAGLAGLAINGDASSPVIDSSVTEEFIRSGLPEGMLGSYDHPFYMLFRRRQGSAKPKRLIVPSSRSTSGLTSVGSVEGVFGKVRPVYGGCFDNFCLRHAADCLKYALLTTPCFNLKKPYDALRVRSKGRSAPDSRGNMGREFSTDFSAYDTSLSHDLLIAVFQASIGARLGVTEDTISRHYRREVATTHIMNPNVMVLCPSPGLPSGSITTSVIGSLCHIVLSAIAWSMATSSLYGSASEILGVMLNVEGLSVVPADTRHKIGISIMVRGDDNHSVAAPQYVTGYLEALGRLGLKVKLEDESVFLMRRLPDPSNKFSASVPTSLPSRLLTKAVAQESPANDLNLSFIGHVDRSLELPSDYADRREYADIIASPSLVEVLRSGKPRASWDLGVIAEHLKTFRAKATSQAMVGSLSPFSWERDALAPLIRPDDLGYHDADESSALDSSDMADDVMEAVTASGFALPAMLRSAADRSILTEIAKKFTVSFLDIIQEMATAVSLPVQKKIAAQYASAWASDPLVESVLLRIRGRLTQI